MGHVVIEPATLRAGARTCHTAGRALLVCARHVNSLPSPEGMPPEARSLMAAASAQLTRSAIAAQSGSNLLTAKAQAGLLADGPFGIDIDLTGPPLISPWEMPKAPPEKRKQEGSALERGLKGFLNEGLDTGKSLLETGAGAAGHLLDGDIGPGAPLAALARKLGVPRLSDQIPYVGDKRKQLDEGVKYVTTHPEEFAQLVKDDLTGAQDRDKGNTAGANGRVGFGVASLLISPARAGAAMKTASNGAKAAREIESAVARQTDAVTKSAVDAKALERTLKEGRPAGRNPLGHLKDTVKAEISVRKSSQEAAAQQRKLAEAAADSRRAAQAAAEARREFAKEGIKIPWEAFKGSAIKVTGQTGAEVTSQQGEKQSAGAGR